MASEQTRGAGETSYGSIPPVNHRAPEVVIHDGLSTHGESSVVEKLKRQPMSPLRRTFCLVVLFDLIITVVLWLLFTEIRATTDSTDAMADFRNQTSNFHFRTSLFDTTLLSLFRFVTLLLTYGLLRSKLPWFVGATTLVTCAYMVVKVVLYNYKYDNPRSALQILDYLLLITPIVISWVEAWLLDLKVIPEEKRELESLLAAERAASEDLNERAPLLSRFLRPARTEESFYSPEPSEAADSHDEDGSDDNRSFYSAYTSNKSHSRTHSRSHSLTSSTSQGTYYKSRMTSAQAEALELIECDDWSKESGTDEVEGVVYSKSTKKWGKVFKLVAEVDVDALTYYNDIVENAAGMPKWNPTVLEVKCLEVVDENTEISYNIAAEGAAGMVSSRDFICIRHWEQLDGWYVTSSIGVEYPAMPPQPKYVRGEQGPGIMRLKDLEPNRLRMEWLLNTNLKGWLPQYLIDQALSGVMLAYLKNLRRYAATLSQAAADS